MEQVDTLYVIPVKEDVSLFPYAERLAMIRAALEGQDDIAVEYLVDYEDTGYIHHIFVCEGV